MKQLSLLLCLFLNGLLLGQSCDYTLSGTIYDFHDNSVLANVAITNNATQQTYYTDSEGKFSIPFLCKGDYEFTLKHELCEEEKVKVQISQNNKKVKWYMEHHIIALQGIETKGKIHPMNKTIAETHLHEEELKKYATESLGTALKQVVGVTALETGNTIAKPMIHGLHSSRLLIINGKTKQEDMEWGIEHAPLLDINAYDDVKILKGASALRYGGDAIAGIVLAQRRRLPKHNKLTGGASLTGIYNGRGGAGDAYIQKKWKNNLGFQVEGGYRKNGDYKTPNYYLSNTGVEQSSLYVEGGWDTFKNKLSVSYSYLDKKLGMLSASHMGNLSDLANAINGTRPVQTGDFTYEIKKPYQEIIHHIVQGEWQKRFRNFGKLEVNYSYQFNHRYEYDNRRGEKKNTASMDFELTTHSGEAFLEINKFKHWKIHTGINGMYQINFPNPKTQVKRLIPDYHKSLVGVFTSVEYNPTPEWSFSGAVRWDGQKVDAKKFYSTKYWNQMNYDKDFRKTIIKKYSNKYLTSIGLSYQNTSSVFGARYRYKSLESTHSFTLNFSQTNRAPNPAELFSEGLHHSAVSIELGDLRLKPENSYKLNFNYTGDYEFLGFPVTLAWDGYYNKIHHFIYQIPVGAENTIRGAYPIWAFQQIEASFLGTDIELSVNMKPLEWNSKFSYLYAQDKTHAIPLINMPPSEWNNRLTYKIASKKYNPYLSLTMDYTAKQNRYPNYNFELKNIVENGKIVDKLVDISSSPSAYFLMGLEGGMSFKLNKNETLLNLRVTNLLNTSYRSYLNRFRYYADNVGRQIQLQIVYKF